MPITVQFRRGSTAESDAFLGEEGELYIDKDKDTVVLHDGVTTGGFPLASEAWVSDLVSNYSSLTVSETNASNTITDQVNGVSAIRFDKDNGFNVENIGNGEVKIKLTSSGSSWKTWQVAGQSSLVAAVDDTVTFVAGTNISISTNTTAKTITFNSTSSFSGSYNDLTNKPTLFSGSYTDLTNKPTFATVATSGSYNDLTNKPTIPSFVNPVFTGTTTLQQTVEVLSSKTGATGTVVHDFSAGAIWYHSGILNNFTANITNVPTTNDRAIVCTLILNQGNTAYIPNVVQIDGVAQTIKWLGETEPVGNINNIDLVSFTLFRISSAWIVTGSLSTFK